MPDSPRLGEAAGEGAGPTVPSFTLFDGLLGHPASMLGFDRSPFAEDRGRGAVPGGFGADPRGPRLAEGPVGIPARAAGAEGGALADTSALAILTAAGLLAFGPVGRARSAFGPVGIPVLAEASTEFVSFASGSRVDGARSDRFEDSLCSALLDPDLSASRLDLRDSEFASFLAEGPCGGAAIAGCANWEISVVFLLIAPTW